MNELIKISHKSKQLAGTIVLPGSKSESNRAIIINALSGNNFKINNISTSDDTKILQHVLKSDNTEINIQNAGTAMRFLVAYYAFTKQNKNITGSERMLERPVEPLVNVLNSLGANIEYIGKYGFPPVKINGKTSILKGKKVKIKADISSQFVSALLMISPLLPEGLEIELENKISSIPYIKMTLGIMSYFGVTSKWEGKNIVIKKQDYVPSDYTVEADWSSAAYWYSMAALSEDAAVFLKGLKRSSFQGDSIIQEWFKLLGVITEFSDTGAFITKSNYDISKLPDIIDFSANPDIAQTIIVLCAVKGLKCKFKGLESLRIKETDRIQALQNELKKFNLILTEIEDGIYSIIGNFNSNALPFIETYNDHRMAMSFAPLALIFKEINIINPVCVNKSYPEFWSDLEIIDFSIEKRK